jgi:argininosuccinate lyase
MPQKKNPDVLELIRGKSARVMAAVPHLLTLVKGLPLAYNRDLQEDKAAFFGALDTVTACLELAPAIIRQARLDRERIASRLDQGFLDATVLMEYLILRGVPMRHGHETVGRLVALCEERKCRLQDLSLTDLQAYCAIGDVLVVDESVYSVLGAENAVAALSSFGSGGCGPVQEQLAAWRRRLATP